MKNELFFEILCIILNVIMALQSDYFKRILTALISVFYCIYALESVKCLSVFEKLNSTKTINRLKGS